MTTATESGSVLLSLASRQVWPHILTAAYRKPSRLILLHSDVADESKEPAKRLKEFFDHRSQIIQPGETWLESIPHDDFDAVEKRLDQLIDRLNLDSNCELNFTGGNKLMATAAFFWAAKHRFKSFYLDRGNRVTWFEPSRDGQATWSETLDGHITNSLDPVALLRCQSLTSEVEREGERLTLSRLGEELSGTEFRKRIEAEFGKPINKRSINWLMESTGEGDKGRKEGDFLELVAAAVLLKLGVTEVRRSLRLKVNAPQIISSHRPPHQEIDLLFNWNGKLWLVDCKDQISKDNLVKKLRQQLRQNSKVKLSLGAEESLGRIRSDLQIGQTKVLKEDLVAINDVGGLLGQVVCVRKSPLPDEVQAYAKRNRIEVVLKNEIFKGFHRLINSAKPESPKAFAALERRFSKPHRQHSQ